VFDLLDNLVIHTITIDNPLSFSFKPGLLRSCYCQWNDPPTPAVILLGIVIAKTILGHYPRLQDYARAFADAILYARCFVKEMNNLSQISEEITDLPFKIRPRSQG
jgi:hypothetical protein